MPFFIPLSVKAAITAGALIGGTIAVVNNKEKILETAELWFQQGADYCRHKLEQEKQKIKFADDIEDNEFYDARGYDEKGYVDTAPSTDYDSMATTPDSSDTEMDFDLQSLD